MNTRNSAVTQKLHDALCHSRSLTSFSMAHWMCKSLLVFHCDYSSSSYQLSYLTLNNIDLEIWVRGHSRSFWPPSATVISTEPFLHGTGTLRCLQKKMATYKHWSVSSLWRDPDDVSHCRILSPDKTEWQLISATLCGWWRCFVADQLWFMTRIREEEVDWKWYHLKALVWFLFTLP